MNSDSTFQLYRLKVTLQHTKDGRDVFSKQPDGTHFFVSGENLIFPCDDHSFPLYALAATLPLLPAKQRVTDEADWMTTDCIIADPDPHNGIVYKIERLEKETFRRGDVTQTNLQKRKDTK